MSDYERKEELKQMPQIHTRVVQRTPKIYDDDDDDDDHDDDYMMVVMMMMMII